MGPGSEVQRCMTRIFRLLDPSCIHVHVQVLAKIRNITMDLHACHLSECLVGLLYNEPPAKHHSCRHDEQDQTIKWVLWSCMHAFMIALRLVHTWSIFLVFFSKWGHPSKRCTQLYLSHHLKNSEIQFTWISQWKREYIKDLCILYPVSTLPTNVTEASPNDSHSTCAFRVHMLPLFVGIEMATCGSSM